MRLLTGLRMKLGVVAITLISTLPMTLSSCSSRNVYEYLQEQGRQECERQPIPQQESCRERYEMDYREYERLRTQEGRTEKR